MAFPFCCYGTRCVKRNRRLRDWRNKRESQTSATNQSSFSGQDRQHGRIPHRHSDFSSYHERRNAASGSTTPANTTIARPRSAAIPHPSDSPISAAAVIRQKPTKGSHARISTIGITPRGKMPRTSMSKRAAITSVSQGTRNIPTRRQQFRRRVLDGRNGKAHQERQVLLFPLVDDAGHRQHAAHHDQWR